MQVLPPILSKIPLLAGILSIFRIFLFFGIFNSLSLFGNLADHSLILKTDGSLHTFGRNNYGQLGTVQQPQKHTTQICLRVFKLPLDITTHLFLSRMDPCILL